jgi:hypothetical protein
MYLYRKNDYNQFTLASKWVDIYDALQITNKDGLIYVFFSR